MTKQELIKKIKTRIELAEVDISMALSDSDRDVAIMKKMFANQILELVEQLDEPQAEVCGVCEHLSALVNENAHQAEQIAILERALSNAINADESFDIEIDCGGEQCNTCFACAYHNYIHEADEQLKNEEFEVI